MWEKYDTVASVFLLMSAANISLAADGDQCQVALRPTVDKGNSSYEGIRSYMFDNAESEFTRLQSMDAQARSLDIGYKTFSLEYGQSSDKREFSLKIKNRVTKEAAGLSEKEVKSYYKTVLSDLQLQKWAECIQATSGTVGHLLLTATYPPESKAIPVKIRWYSPKYDRQGKLTLSAINGIIDYGNIIRRKSSGSFHITDGDVITFFLIANDIKEPVMITANIPRRGGTDSLVIRVKPVTEVAQTKVEQSLSIETLPFTFQDDTRRARHLTCPAGKEIKPASGQCLHVGVGNPTVKASTALGPYTWECEWAEFQVSKMSGLGVQAVCETPMNPMPYKDVEHVRIEYTTQGPFDNRIQKELTCPPPKVIVPGSATCLRTADSFGQIAQSMPQGLHKWTCTWNQHQPEGVGISIHPS